jgi:2-iminobutanoate/2-iminopropanoate deaminase
MKYIQTNSAPAAVGPYSQAIVENGFVFCSGQIGLDAQGNLQSGLENQIVQIMKNIESVLSAAESDITKIVKTTIFVTDINDFAKVNEIYGTYFTAHKPARSTIGVAALPKGAVVEIECVAVQ